VKFGLQRVRYIPKALEPGVLYVSDEFHTAAHLCACGCGAKIRTPLGANEWSVDDTAGGPTLWPSVGNWQQGCRSHYWFRNGDVIWGEPWTPQQVAAGREQEQARRRAYYDGLYPTGSVARLWNWLRRRFTRS
jgi:hypothetical protein